MNYEEMKEAIKLVDGTERCLGRLLTDEEKDIIINKGLAAFYKSIDLDFTIFHGLKELISTYMTGTDECYKKCLNNCEDCASELAKVLRDIADDLDPQCCYGDCDTDKEGAAIDLLLEGKELELTDEEIDEVIDELEDRFDSYMITVNDGKVTVKVK